MELRKLIFFVHYVLLIIEINDLKLCKSSRKYINFTFHGIIFKFLFYFQLKKLYKTSTHVKLP